uniref:Uncharacterized protein n=1 Tax=Rhipicephalus zambeziensis TaxID=60191 RepID=A0A224Y868_9ACAR
MSSFVFSFLFVFFFFRSLPFPSGRCFLDALIRFRQPFYFFFFFFSDVSPLASLPFRRWRPRKEFKTIKRETKNPKTSPVVSPLLPRSVLVGLE